MKGFRARITPEVQIDFVEGFTPDMLEQLLLGNWLVRKLDLYDSVIMKDPRHIREIVRICGSHWRRRHRKMIARKALWPSIAGKKIQFIRTWPEDKIAIVGRTGISFYDLFWIRHTCKTRGCTDKEHAFRSEYCALHAAFNKVQYLHERSAL